MDLDNWRFIVTSKLLFPIWYLVQSHSDQLSDKPCIDQVNVTFLLGKRFTWEVSVYL